MEPTSSSAVARQTWELENNIPAAPSNPDAMDAIYRYDEAANGRAHQEKPWATDPHHFRRARISALALLKMVVHGHAGGTIEIMGLMQGKFQGDSIIVMDAFALPSRAPKPGSTPRPTPTSTWSSTPPSTSRLEVDIGAFRTYPKDYKPPDEPVSEYQTIPLKKIEDFGVHFKQYYSLDITYFNSSLDSHLLDLLWNKYWVNKLSSSPLLGNRDYVVRQIFDLADKLEQAEGQLAHSRFGMLMPSQRKKEVSFCVHAL
uniref:COP9 signalosome complex subunit 5 n=1 Tax=Hordeum vulgare subsp. vulgare TaxID=112509 RepID=A0A8I6YV39_HORVV